MCYRHEWITENDDTVATCSQCGIIEPAELEEQYDTLGEYYA
jgi:hypothetical protein